MPRLVSCGSRNKAYDDFVLAQTNKRGDDFVALWIDSEHPVKDIERTWAHLRNKDHWKTPAGATDDQVLFMTTCMETWILADQPALHEHYGTCLANSALPPLHDLERRDKGDIQRRLFRVSENCGNAYSKGKPSFEILGKLTPATLETHLPSFARVRRILDERL
ncbi:MAG: DUF4276 family protein [Bryobacterales bacterium]|nr:DUF4276 family protein [Bryobacterales bacterium]